MTDRYASSGSEPVQTPDTPARKTSMLGAVRSLAFIVLFCLYLLLVMELGQRLVIWPLITILPKRRLAISRAWLRLHARVTFALARSIAGVRLTIEGSLPAEPIVVVMNHQSLLDIPLGVLLVRGPYPLIPTRDRYGRRIPGISGLVRLSRFPLVSQGKTATRNELRALRDAAHQVASGDNSLLIYPEGHRTRQGAITDFMKAGLSLILSRANRPVYCIVADGMWHARVFSDVALRFAGTRISARVIGPFDPPSRDEMDDFIDNLRREMIEALADMRRSTAERAS
jgi:1-acyl-sn-glycerol-3-phosphate acyltransferase